MGALLRGQDLTELGLDSIQLGAQLRGHGFHEALGAFLALVKNFVHALALFGAEVEFALGATKELEAIDTGRHRWGHGGIGILRLTRC